MLTSVNKRTQKTTKYPLLAVAVTSVMLTACNTTPNSDGINNNTAFGTLNGFGGNQPAADTYPNVGNSVNNSSRSTVPNFVSNTADNDKNLQRLSKVNKLITVNNSQALINEHGNIWGFLRNNSNISCACSSSNPSIIAYKKWFATNGVFLNDTASRASRYIYYTANQALLNGLPIELSLLPMIESAYHPFITNNSRGEVGLWQLSENTVSKYGYSTSNDFNPRLDVVLSTRIAYLELAKYKRQFGSWDLAIAAKHAGEAVVYQAVQANKLKDQSTEIWALNLPVETKNHVAKFWALVDVINNPNESKVRLPAVANTPYFAPITVNSGTSLRAVANRVGVNANEVTLLNPSLIQGIVKGNVLDKILVPAKNMQISSNRTQGSNSPSPILASNQNSPKPFMPKNGGLNPQYVGQRNSLPVLTSNRQTEPQVMQGDMYEIKKHVNSEPVRAVNLPARKSNYDKNIQKEPIPTSGYYTVQSGNTLRGTAVKFGIKPSYLAKINDLSITDNLTIGQKLKLVDNVSAQVIKPAAVTDKPVPNNLNPGLVPYTVQPNDNLTKIARTANITVPDIAKINSLSINSNLHAGSTIYLPKTTVVYKVRRNDTLYSLARKHNITIQKLANMNGVSTEYRLQKGEHINVPY